MLLQSVFFTPAGDGFSPPVTGVKLANSLAESPKLTSPLTTDSASHAGATALAVQNKAVLLRSGAKFKLNVLAPFEQHDLKLAESNLALIINYIGYR